MCQCGGNCKCNNKDDSHEKALYPIRFCAEDEETVYVEMTKEEALVVSRVLKEANESISSRYCGSVSINIENAVKTD